MRDKILYSNKKEELFCFNHAVLKIMHNSNQTEFTPILFKNNIHYDRILKCIICEGEKEEYGDKMRKKLEERKKKNYPKS